MPPLAAATKATRPFSPKSTSSHLAAGFVERPETAFEQALRVFVEEDDGARVLLRQKLDEPPGLVGDAALALLPTTDYYRLSPASFLRYLSNQARRKRIWATRLEGWRRENSALKPWYSSARRTMAVGTLRSLSAR